MKRIHPKYRDLHRSLCLLAPLRPVHQGQPAVEICNVCHPNTPANRMAGHRRHMEKFNKNTILNPTVETYIENAIGRQAVSVFIQFSPSPFLARKNTMERDQRRRASRDQKA